MISLIGWGILAGLVGALVLVVARWLGKRTGRQYERDLAEMAENREGQRTHSGKMEKIILREEGRKLKDHKERAKYESFVLDAALDTTGLSHEAQDLIAAARERRKNL